MPTDAGARIIEKARELGAALAGIARVAHLKRSPSHEIIKRGGLKIDGIDPYREIGEVEAVAWPAGAETAVVIAVSHPEDQPELDWWIGLKGTLGNSELIRVNRELSTWIEDTLKIKTHRLPYFVEAGGIFLKDAAVLAGLGCIGKNNLLVTPEFGPRVRLRALLLEEALTPTGPGDFDPCDDCEAYCQKVCPRRAHARIVFSASETQLPNLPGRDGSFSRAKCMLQMDQNCSDAGVDVNATQRPQVDIEGIGKTAHHVKYCRRCEFACPIGK